MGGLPGLERNLGPSHSRPITQAHVQDLSRAPDHAHPAEGEHPASGRQAWVATRRRCSHGVDGLWTCDWGYLLVVAGSPSMFGIKSEMGGGQGSALRHHHVLELRTMLNSNLVS